MDLINVLFWAATVVAIVVILVGLHDIDVRLTRMEQTIEGVCKHVSTLPTFKTDAVQSVPRQFKWR
jgi:hypothetical protein